MPVIPAGSFNPNATIAPGVVVIESLTSGAISGIPTNLVGMVGTATWGPVDSPITITNTSDYANSFGSVQTTIYDMGTAVTAALLQGTVGNYPCVRVTDGTDEMAFTELMDAASTPVLGATLTAKYSGSTGNTLQASVVAGSAANAYTVNVGRSGYASETYTNIAGTGATFWANLVSAINNGQSGVRGPSNLVVATQGNGISAVTMTVNGSGYTADFPVTFIGGGGSGATATANIGYAISSVTIGTPGVYDNQPLISTSGPGAGATFVLHVSTINLFTVTTQSGFGSYAPGDTLTAVGGTFTTATSASVNTTQLHSATVVSGGTGGTPGTAIVTGTTGTGTKFQASVTISGGGVMTSVNSIAVAGSYTVNPTLLTAEPVTGGGLSGATLNIKMGAATTTITVAGNYTVFPTSPVATTTSGSGTGATVTMVCGLLAINVTAGGNNYDATSQIVVTAVGPGTSGAASIVLAASGNVKSVTIDTPGANFTSVPTADFSAGDGTLAAGTPVVGSTTIPSIALNPYTFTGGTDGNTGVTGITELGVDGALPTGMYALQNTGVSMFALVGNDDVTTFTDQDSFGAQNGCQAILVGEPGQTVAQAVAAKNTAGIADNYSVFLVGDWCYFLDTNNGGITRLISPQGFYAGEMANLAPQLSPLNKPLSGIIATQKTSMNQVYSQSDIVTMMTNGLEVISNPISAGNVFGCKTGKSGGLDLALNNVCVQRMANFLAYSFSNSGVLGTIPGDLNTPTVRSFARTVLLAFLKNLEASQTIQNSDVFLDESNNPPSLVQLGFLSATINVQVFSVIIVFLINLNVGTASIQSVTQVTP